MNMGRPGSGNVDALTVTTGVVVPHVEADGGCTLGVSTYYFPVGTPDAVLPAETAHISIHLKWAAAVAGTITLETCNFPSKLKGSIAGGPTDVVDYSSTAGDWMPFNPTASGALYVGVSGASNSATAFTLTAGGAAAGGAMYNIPANGARRMRVKLVLTTGGIVRCNVHGKAGS